METLPDSRPLQSAHPTIEDIVRDFLRYIQRTLTSFRVHRDDIDDVTQVVLERVARGLYFYEPARCSLKTWLYRIIQRRAADYHRSRRKEARDFPTVADAESEFANLRDPTLNCEERMEEHTIESEQHRLLEQLLDTLPEERRLVFEAREILGLKHTEIAEIYGIPVSTVKARIRLAWEHINAALKRRRAAQHFRGAVVLPLSAVTLMERERNATMQTAPDELVVEILGSLQKSLSTVLPTPVRVPTQLRSWVLRWRAGVVRFIAGAVVGGVIVYLLMRHTESPNSARVGSAPSLAHELVSTESGDAVTLHPVVVADPAANNQPPALVHVAAPAPRADVASVAAPRPPAPARLPGAAPEDTEAHLLRNAREALKRGEVDRARVILERHAHEFPDGALKELRADLQKRLPR